MLYKIDEKIDKIDDRLERLEDKIDRLNKEWEIEELPPKQKEILDFLKEHPEGLGVWDLAKANDIPYSDCYMMLKELKKKGLVEERRSKGYSWKYYPKIKYQQQ